jgi:hypothetical protein
MRGRGIGGSSRSSARVGPRVRNSHAGPRAQSIAIAGAIVLAFGTGGILAIASGEPAPRAHAAHNGPSARTARTLNGTDSAHLHLVRQHEMIVFEEGAATGALPGHMRAQLDVGSVFTGTCTIYTSGGTITGRGRATPHGTGRYQSFSGSLQIIGGTGRYAHAHGRTGLYGTFDRRTFSLVIQTTGAISY